MFQSMYKIVGETMMPKTRYAECITRRTDARDVDIVKRADTIPCVFQTETQALRVFTVTDDIQQLPFITGRHL